MSGIEAQTSQKNRQSQHRSITQTRSARQAALQKASEWQGAAWGALSAVIIILFAAAHGLFGQAAPVHFILGAVLFLLSFGFVGMILTLIWRLIHGIPIFYVWVMATAVPALVLMVMTSISVAIGIIVPGFAVLATASIIGASLYKLKGGGWNGMRRAERSLTVAGLCFGVIGLITGGAWLLDPGSPLEVPPNAAVLSSANVEPLDLPKPTQTGPYSVRTLFYGSGNDLHRPEYSENVDLITHTVDGSMLVEGWSGLRTRYWGFGPEALPLNGRVWFPEGKGPYPLVVFVHGQHPMHDYSDPGYGYLGELLTSRGFIVVSVDENFLNLSPLVDKFIIQSLKEENDLRGWLLLEHLQTWREWNQDPAHPFFQSVDMDKIAIIGHSRGGEAVALAAAFNHLQFAPDNANLIFDYHFNIRSVIAIAPVVGTIKPAGQEVVLENINYLVLHGAHDMDVFTFQGDCQYSRTIFTDGGDWFKAAVYIYGANHGQFNTSWGRKDLFEPVMRVFNLEQLLPGQDQQQVAEATISAFLEATLHGESAYREFFQDLRRGADWLPDTIYLHQYQDAHTQMIATFEEDIDLTSTSQGGGYAKGERLTLWREQPARAKCENLGSQTVYLGWDAEVSPNASFTVQIPRGSLEINSDSVLVFRWQMPTKTRLRNLPMTIRKFRPRLTLPSR